MRVGRWFVLAAALALIALRAPRLLLRPRLWAEEGSDFFHNAWHSSFWSAIVFTEPEAAGYLNLAANLPAAIAAHTVALETVPLVFTASSLLPLLLSISIILFGRSLIWSTPGRQVVAIAILLFCPAATGEVWLNSINAQVYWGFAGLCILCEDLDDRSPGAVAIFLATLVVGGLSGAYTNFLLPAFAFKALRERGHVVYAAIAILVFTTAIQVAFVLWSDALGWQGLPPDWARAIAHSLYAQIAVPLVGRDIGRWVANYAGAVATLSWLSAILLAVLAVGSAALVFERRRGAPSHLLVVAFASLAVATTLSAQDSLAGGRYAVLPGFTLLLILMDQTSDRQAGWRRACAGGLVALAVAIGVLGYQKDPAFSCPVVCPDWHEEVARWRRDADTPMRIWPYRYRAVWTVRLDPDRGRPGTPGAAHGNLQFPFVRPPETSQPSPTEEKP